MTPQEGLRLARRAALPTVWTGGLAGWFLSGAAPDPGWIILLLVALSLVHFGAALLDDPFTARGGSGSRRAAGLGLATLGAALAFGLGVEAGLAGVVLAAALLLHAPAEARTGLGPVVFGLCRVLTYVTAALAAGGPAGALWAGAAGLFCHVVGAAYASRQDAYDRVGAAWPLAVLAAPVVIAAVMLNGKIMALLLAAYAIWSGWALSLLFRRREGDVRTARAGLVAAVALFDAVMIAGAGAHILAFVAVACFAASLALERAARER